MAKRVDSHSELDTSEVCYWKSENGIWLVYLPGCGAGELRNHTVVEHEDGTISVTPSILMDGHKDGQRTQKHGYLTRGEWRDA